MRTDIRLIVPSSAPPPRLPLFVLGIARQSLQAAGPESLATLRPLDRLARSRMPLTVCPLSNLKLRVVSTLAGLLMVVLGMIGPAFAAFYNFATDFLPIGNVFQLLKIRKEKPVVR